MKKNLFTVFWLNPASPFDFKLIHYICLSSQLEKNPDAELTIYSNDLNKAYEFKWFSKLCMKYPDRIKLETIQMEGNNGVGNGASDLPRFFLLKQFGGIYIDMDVLAVKPYPEEFWESTRAIQGFEPDPRGTRGLGTAVMIVPDNEAGKAWIDVILEPYQKSNNFREKGPYEYPIYRPARVCQLHKDKVDVKDFKVFYPLSYYYEDVEEFFLLEGSPDKWISEDTVCIHLWENRTSGIIKPLSEKYFQQGLTPFAELGKPYIE